MAQRIGQAEKSRLQRHTDTQLVGEWQAGVPGAAEILLERHAGWLEQFFRGRLRSSARASDVHDLRQTTLLRLTASIQKLKKPGSFRAFLKRIAEWTFVDWLRNKYRHARCINATDAQRGRTDDEWRTSDIFDAESSHRQRVIRDLPPEELELLWRYFMESSTSAELARELGYNPATLRSRVSVSKAKLAKSLGRPNPQGRRAGSRSDRRVGLDRRSRAVRHPAVDRARRARPRRSGKLER